MGDLFGPSPSVSSRRVEVTLAVLLYLLVLFLQVVNLTVSRLNCYILSFYINTILKLIKPLKIFCNTLTISLKKSRKVVGFDRYIVYVIVLPISFQSVIVMVLTLFSPAYFRKLWRICDLISIYYLFGRLRICCWVWPEFCWGNFGKLLMTFLAKIKTEVL